MAYEIAMSGDVGWEITADFVRAELAKAGGGDVITFANSRGGFVFEAIEIFNLFRNYKGNVEHRITGLAASSMSYIVLSGNKVTAYDNAVFMIHNAMSFAVGNHNEMRKVADTLEGLSNIFAREYAKKTDKDVSKMSALMDDETFLFGDDMKAAGFVDEIIDAPDDADGDDDKASAIVTANASVQACFARMRADEAANADLARAVAYMDGMSALLDDPAAPQKPAKPVAVVAPGTTNTPAVAGQGKQEDKNMTFEEYLAANPVAQAAYDAAIAKAYTDGEAAAKSTMDAVIAKVSPQLTSPDYGPDVKDAGIKAITGEGHISTFETLVIMADRDTEAAKAAAAKAESEGTPETPAAAAGSDAVADAEAKAVYDSKKERLKGQGV